MSEELNCACEILYTSSPTCSTDEASDGDGSDFELQDVSQKIEKTIKKLNAYFFILLYFFILFHQIVRFKYRHIVLEKGCDVIGFNTLCIIQQLDVL